METKDGLAGLNHSDRNSDKGKKAKGDQTCTTLRWFPTAVYTNAKASQCTSFQLSTIKRAQLELYKSFHFSMRISYYSLQNDKLPFQVWMKLRFLHQRQLAGRTGQCDNNCSVCYCYYGWFAVSSFVFIILHQCTILTIIPSSL